MVALETSRLLLRMPEAADAAPLMDIHQDSEAIKRVMLTAPPGGITVAWRNIAMMIGHWHLRGYGQWTVVEKSTGTVIGRVGLWNPEGWPGIELGWIIRRARWNNGFATEAAGASLAWARANVDADRVISMIEPDNIPAIRVAEKIGERFERADALDGRSVHIYRVRRRTDQRR